jgi:hypothetical protein
VLLEKNSKKFFSYKNKVIIITKENNNFLYIENMFFILLYQKNLKKLWGKRYYYTKIYIFLKINIKKVIILKINKNRKK